MELINKNLVLKTTKKKDGETAIQQVQARELKASVTDTITALISETYGVDTFKTDDGIIILVPNEEYGSIPLSLDIKVKSLDYDYQSALECYELKQIEKLKKAEEKKALRDKAKA